MNERLTPVLVEGDQKGCALFSALEPSPFDRALLGNALEVSPGQSLLHYLPLNRFKSLLTNRAIYMRRLDLFDLDPQEGQFPAANSTRQASITEQLGIPADVLKDRRDFIEGSMRQLTYLHCWFGWDVEDQRMWEEFGEKGAGACLRTTARRLREALCLPANFVVNLCGVTYSDDGNPVSELISFLPSCRKRPKFAHEREIRLIGQLGEKAWPATITSEGNTTPDHQLVPVNFERLFERVYVGPNAPDVTFQEIDALANDAAGSRVVQRSKILPF